MRGLGTRAFVALALLVGAAVAVAAPATAANRPAKTREVRSVVPMGKSDAEFGRVVKMPAGRATPPSTPLVVRLRASATPRLGQPFTLELQVHAYRSAPGTQVHFELPEGAVVVSGDSSTTLDLAAGETRSLIIVAELTKTGQNEIDGKAFRQVSPGESWGDLDQLFFTMGQDRSRVGYKTSTGNVEAPAHLVAGSASVRTGTPRATANFKICWNMINRAGGTTPFRDALVYLADADTGSPDILAQAFTNDSGCATFNGVNTADADEGGLIDPFVEIQTQHTGRYRVQTYGGGIYFCDSTAHTNAGGSFNFGTWNCGGTSGVGRAFPLFDDIYVLRRFINEHAVNLGFGAPVADCTVRWEIGGTDGTYYSTGDKLVHLADGNQRSRDITLHECSHRQMDVLYHNQFPATDCPSPHFLNGVSGKICAWTEGWTYVDTAGADGNPQYTFDDGSSLNLETANCNTPNFDDGPNVEARVGGTLIDLMDPFTNSFGTVSGFSNETSPCGGNDNVSGQYGHIWALMSEQKDKVFIAQDGQNDSFSRAWKAKKDDGYPQAEALAAGKVNSISNFTKDSAPK